MTLGTQAQPHGKLLDYEQFIDHQLERTRSRIKFTDIMTAGLTLLVGFLGVLFLEVVLDHMVGLPLLTRRLVLSAGVTIAAAFAAIRIAMPLLRRINGIYAAKTIEDADPAFKNSLINYLELRRYRGQMPKAIMATLQARAVTDLTQVEIDNVVNQQRMLRAFYTLSAVTVIFSLYALFSPKSILDSTRRAFLADVVRPTNTQLVNIKPGNDPKLAEIVAGDHAIFSVHVEGVRPQKVLLHYSVDGGKFFAIREFAPGRLMYDPWQITLTNMQQTVEYYLTGGDAESLHYRLKVLPAPTITSMELDLTFPSYTQVPPRSGIEGGTVEAIEGTDVTVHARTNMPASLATLDISNETPAPMEIASDDPTVLTGRFKVKTSGTYKVNFRTTGNQLNPNPVVYDIIAIPDRPPTARFVQPDKPSVKVPANVNVDLEMTGNDDHGVKDATLHVAMGNEKLVSKNMLEGRPPQSEFKAIETFDLAKNRVKPGSTPSYWLTVRDNKEPSSNRTETARQIIEVTEPVSAPEKKKIEDSQQKDREQLDPTASSSADEESSADKPPPPESGKNGGENNDSGKGAPADDANQKPKDNGAQGTAGTGSADESNPDNKPGGPNNNSPQLSPDDQRIADKLKQALNNKKASNPPGDQANPANTQLKDGNSPPGNPRNADASRNNGKSQGGAQDSGKARGNDSQRPATEDTGQPNSRTAPSRPGDASSNDSSNQVQRADRSDNQPPSAAGRQGNDNPGATPNQPADREQAKSKGDSNNPLDTTRQGRTPGDSRANDGTNPRSPQTAGNDSKGNRTKSANSGDQNAGEKSGDQNADNNSNAAPGESTQSRDSTSGKSANRNGDPANKPNQGERQDPSSAAKTSESQKNKTGHAQNENGSPAGGANKDGAKEQGNNSSSTAKTDDGRTNTPKRDATNQKGDPSAGTDNDATKRQGSDPNSSTKTDNRQKSSKSGDSTKQD
ncbi:MAG TPA: hypothetical protein VHS97_13615, partial [Isosphaeraceae bacterium]|nr:hypothetical protein [Isosphaeraceae bacterium]